MPEGFFLPAGFPLPEGKKMENIGIEIYFLYIDIFLRFELKICLKYRYVNLESALSIQNCNYASIYKNSCLHIDIWEQKNAFFEVFYRYTKKEILYRYIRVSIEKKTGKGLCQVLFCH